MSNGSAVTGTRLMGSRKYHLIYSTKAQSMEHIDKRMILQAKRIASIGIDNYKRIFGKPKTIKGLSKRGGALEAIIEKLGKQGLDPFPYLNKRYGVYDAESLLKVPTKKISGLISDLSELARVS